MFTALNITFDDVQEAIYDTIIQSNSLQCSCYYHQNITGDNVCRIEYEKWFGCSECYIQHTEIPESIARYIVIHILSPIVQTKYQTMLQQQQQRQEQQQESSNKGGMISHAEKVRMYHKVYMEMIIGTARCTVEDLVRPHKLQQQQHQHQHQHQQDQQQDQQPQDLTTSTVNTAMTATPVTTKNTGAAATPKDNGDGAVLVPTTTKTNDSKKTTTSMKYLIEEYIIECLCTDTHHRYGGLSIIHLPYIKKILSVFVQYYLQYTNPHLEVVLFLQLYGYTKLAKVNCVDLFRNMVYTTKNIDTDTTSSSPSSSTTTAQKTTIRVVDEDFVQFVLQKQSQTGSVTVQQKHPQTCSISSQENNKITNVLRIESNALSQSSTSTVECNAPKTFHHVQHDPNIVNVQISNTIQSVASSFSESSGVTAVSSSPPTKKQKVVMDDVDDDEKKALPAPKNSNNNKYKSDTSSHSLTDLCETDKEFDKENINTQLEKHWYHS